MSKLPEQITKISILYQITTELLLLADRIITGNPKQGDKT